MNMKFKLNLNIILIYKYQGVELDLEKAFDFYDSINTDIFINVYSRVMMYIIFVI